MTGITRTEYKRSRGEIRPYRKVEALKIDDHHYLLRNYNYNNVLGKFEDSTRTCWFDGEILHNGIVCYTGDNVDTMFELRKKYEGYKDIE